MSKSTAYYDHLKIEKKWQEKWISLNLYSPDVVKADKPFYSLMMFPYPSAEGLHVGNMYAFAGADVFSRYKRMNGYDVLEPIGLDGFGIHSENYAIKVGRHPSEQAKLAEENFYRQLRSIGNSFDWKRRLETYDPGYYKWTQWIFIQLFKKGLAYRKKAEVNWCPKDLTVLSDEQVIDGRCERCDSKVERKELEQWFFRITKYAKRLLNNIEGLKWSERVKIAQKNWIGKSEGARVKFELEVPNQPKKAHFLEIFTTRPDTLFGATFMVVSPELAKAWMDVGWQADDEVKKYIKEAIDRRAIDQDDKEKTGVFAGVNAINPVNGGKLPVWVSDYVLAGYGTGAIMAVPAHDQRDYDFAKKYNLPIIEVISQDSQSEKVTDKAYDGEGKLVNSEDWNGFQMPNDMDKVLTLLEENNLGKRESNYHLRDWLISRQRYWGPPIPLIYCQKCNKEKKGENEEMPGWFSVPEEDLPVLLPEVNDWKPMGTGKAPLANHPEFFKTRCPNCSSEAVRETDVSDTFLDSAWYFLRYPSTDLNDKAFDKDRTKKWLPVNQYIGGAEHAVLHLLYSRFITMVLHDLGYVDFEEPFENFFAHGLIIKDGAKMSKSKGNVVVPDEYIQKYGADSLRSYLMFLGPYSDGGDFRDSGIEGMYKFIRKVWKLIGSEVGEGGSPSPEAEKILNKTVKKVTEDIENFSYNTAIASLMEWYNFLVKQKEISKVEREVYLKLIAPFAPHITEEIWESLGYDKSIHKSEWPKYDESKIVENESTIVVQVNGKRRAEIKVPTDKIGDEDYVKEVSCSNVDKYLKDKEIKKTIYVSGKIINFVILIE